MTIALSERITQFQTRLLHELEKIMSDLSDDLTALLNVVSQAETTIADQASTITTQAATIASLTAELGDVTAQDAAVTAATTALEDAITAASTPPAPPTPVPETLTVTAPDSGELTIAVGSAVSGVFTVTGGTAPYTFAATSTDPDVTVDAEGNLGGTSSVTGASTVTVTVTDATSATADATLTINAS
jgi:hypothetical protein